MSQFGERLKKLRADLDLTLEDVARKIGTHKSYISGIENGKVNPPSVKMIKKLAKVLREDEKLLVRLAWVEKAPAMLREEAQDFLRWLELGKPTPDKSAGR